MLEKTFEKHHEIYRTHTPRTVSQIFFFFYGDSAMKTFEGTQQEDPESPVLN